MSPRTTITLDDDVFAKVRAEMRRTGGSFKETVNSLLRRAAEKRKAEPRKPFKVEARDLGTYPGLNYDNIGELLQQLEGPFHK
jgi:hypothetical protein